MSVDWHSEVNAVKTEVQDALEVALAACKDWDDVVIIWGSDTGANSYRLCYDRNDSMTDERMLWMLANAQYKFLDESVGDGEA